MSAAQVDRGGERGAVSTLIVVLLTASVLMGFLALSVDVGLTVLERRELQNGADAGALALAQSCLETGPLEECDTLELQALVDANAADGEHLVSLVCGTGRGLEPCDPERDRDEDIQQCPRLPEAFLGLDYVQVHTRTSSDGGGPLQNVFGAAASAGETTSSVDTCARAVWGSPANTGPTLPMTISVCAWDEATDGGVEWAPRPPYLPAPAIPPAAAAPAVPVDLEDDVTALVTHGGPSEDCGTFAWLDDESGECSAEFGATGVASGASEPSGGCQSDGLQRWLGQEVLIPVFSDADADGDGHFTFTFTGVASFYFAGWINVPSVSPETYEIFDSAGLDLCLAQDGGDDEDDETIGGGCIWGWFTAPLVSDAALDPTVPWRGPSTVQLAG